MSEKLLSVPPRIYKRHVCNSSSGGDLHLERWSIPMISPRFPPLTLKIVEHSRYLPIAFDESCGKWAEGSDESDAMIEMEAQGSDKP